MATLTSFYPYIVPHVSGCPEITIDTHLMSSIIEFSERTMILERDHDPVTIVKDISDYDFEPPINNHLVIVCFLFIMKVAPVLKVATVLKVASVLRSQPF